MRLGNHDIYLEEELDASRQNARLGKLSPWHSIVGLEPEFQQQTGSVGLALLSALSPRRR
jgi:hypothetical protein